MTEYLTARWYRTVKSEVWHAFETWRTPGAGVARHLSLCGREGHTRAVQQDDGDWHCKECMRRLRDRQEMEA